ncbi:MAG: hexose kinase [Rubrobacter sp.]|nr:hexose kinase [Rubrobacter sp.]
MILCVGGTPAMQRTLSFERLVPGSVNRANEVRVTASGKVTNAARVAATLGSRAVFVSFLGGDSGRFVAENLDGEGIVRDVVWTGAPTRTCATLLHDGGKVTELVEEAEAVSAEGAAALEDIARKHLPKADALCLIGSLPSGVPEDFYARLVEAASEAGVPSLVDAQGAPLVEVLAAEPFVVKPNLEEAVATLGLRENADARDAALALVEPGAEWAVVSEGAKGSVLANRSGKTWRVSPPNLEAVNPIGSGDSMAAGFLHSLTKGSSVPEAAAYGTACAAANVLTDTSGVVRTSDVEELLPKVRVSKEPIRSGETERCGSSMAREGRGKC